MRKEGLPFPCDQCKETFASKGARKMHKRSKHQVRVHTFEGLAQHLKGVPDPVASPPAAGRLFTAVMAGALMFAALASTVAVIWFMPPT